MRRRWKAVEDDSVIPNARSKKWSTSQKSPSVFRYVTWVILVVVAFGSMRILQYSNQHSIHSIEKLVIALVIVIGFYKTLRWIGIVRLFYFVLTIFLLGIIVLFIAKLAFILWIMSIFGLLPSTQ